MLSWFQALMPKEHAYFRMFDQHARLLVDGAEALRRMFDGGDDVARWCRAVADFEEQADAVTREVLHHVGRSFITPFDRHHIKSLTTTLDDAIDQMQKTAKTVTLFEQRDFAPEMRGMADIIIQMAHSTVDLVGKLEKLRQNSDAIGELTQKIVNLENDSDQLYDRGVKALFLKHRNGQALDYIIGAEIYDHLEKAADRFEDVANRVSTILIEHL
jgi:predicted phosphate transport protein (TIGR00153 family)